MQRQSCLISQSLSEKAQGPTTAMKQKRNRCHTTHGNKLLKETTSLPAVSLDCTAAFNHWSQWRNTPTKDIICDNIRTTDLIQTFLNTRRPDCSVFSWHPEDKANYFLQQSVVFTEKLQITPLKTYIISWLCLQKNVFVLCNLQRKT